ncbi:MAG: hypothetical protein OEV94_10170 [Deltaproteobacteria bacterium]|nr:hypothetical protein [Deltaproteobacteria bacterium]MDH4122057.1 hypothetical protein [Deltaproteobacteria bacterium]
MQPPMAETVTEEVPVRGEPLLKETVGEADPKERVFIPPKDPVKRRPGNCPEEELANVQQVCRQAENDYTEVMTALQTVRASERVLRSFQARAGNLTPDDLDQAKKEFEEARGNYIQAGNRMSQGILAVNTAAQTWPDDILVQRLYLTYLAKLLASLETRNTVEPFIELLAQGEFHFDRTPPEMTPKDTQRRLTPQQKMAEYLSELEGLVQRLEVRYAKRQLQNRLRQGESPLAVARELNQLIQRDPEDMRSYIWLAHLKGDLLTREKNQNKRVALRDDILNLCKKAFSMIDDYLTLQGIHDLSERDRQRTDWIKTITAIRKPLLT